jgi:protein-L-isoaspartate(D-aspartate) O-methyltransferase
LARLPHVGAERESGIEGMTTNPSQQEQAARRLYMVNGQLRTSDVDDKTLLAAFLEVPRERFLPPAFAKLAYVDQDQLALGAVERRILAPRTLARLLQAATVAPGERVLDVGGGSGYTAAILSNLGASVVLLESDAGALSAARAALADSANVDFAEGDLAAGAPSKGPFDVIFLDGAFETTPKALLEQLAPGGRLVGVDARTPALRGVLIEKAAMGLSERSLFDVRADVLPGFRKTPSFAF